MKEQIFSLIAYKPETRIYCKSCLVEQAPEDYQTFDYINTDRVIELATIFLTKECESWENSYDLTLYSSYQDELIVITEFCKCSSSFNRDFDNIILEPMIKTILGKVNAIKKEREDKKVEEKKLKDEKLQKQIADNERAIYEQLRKKFETQNKI